MAGHLRLNPSDAAMLSIEPRDYRAGANILPRSIDAGEIQLSENPILNEAVHVLSVPCPEALFKEHRVLIWAHHRASMSSADGERSKHQRISRALFNADTEHRTAFLKELCAYCRALGAKPVGSPADATREDACRLARDLWEEKQACDDVSMR